MSYCAACNKKAPGHEVIMNDGLCNDCYDKAQKAMLNRMKENIREMRFADEHREASHTGR